MRILIIEQVRSSFIRYQLFEKFLLTSFSILPTLYARHLASITPKNHSVTIINERYEPIRVSEEYDLVVIHFSSGAYARAYEIADAFRKRKVTVVLSGLHVSAFPEEALEHADSVLLGRGEGNYLELLNDIDNNQLKTIYDPCDYDSYDIPLTRVDLPGFMMTGAVEATRGCPYQCSFCPDANTPYGDVYYKRSIGDVIEEIKQIPQKTIMFYDASLTIDPAYTKELFRRMIPLNKRFFCNGNVNVLAEDEELVALSRKAGCISWLIGFESISQKTLDEAGKVTNTVETYKTAVDSIHTHHMAVVGDFMFGFDTDTPKVFVETLSLISDLGVDVADFSILTPFPGTPIFESFKEQGRILTTDWHKYNMHSVVFEPRRMTPLELIQGVQFLYARFYNPIETLKRVSKSLRLGLYPFFMVISRNVISMIASQKIARISKKNERD